MTDYSISLSGEGFLNFGLFPIYLNQAVCICTFAFGARRRFCVGPLDRCQHKSAKKLMKNFVSENLLYIFLADKIGKRLCLVHNLLNLILQVTLLIVLYLCFYNFAMYSGGSRQNVGHI